MIIINIDIPYILALKYIKKKTDGNWGRHIIRVGNFNIFGSVIIRKTMPKNSTGIYNTSSPNCHINMQFMYIYIMQIYIIFKCKWDINQYRSYFSPSISFNKF